MDCCVHTHTEDGGACDGSPMYPVIQPTQTLTPARCLCILYGIVEDCLVDEERRGHLGIMCGDEKIFFLLHLFCIRIMVIEAKARHGEIKFKKGMGEGRLSEYILLAKSVYNDDTKSLSERLEMDGIC